MTTTRRIVITGFMGAGKTTIAFALARLWNCRHVDLDELIVAREGRTPQELIDEEGEVHFREVETLVLRQALEDDDEASRIIATGGGAWTLERNRSLIAAHHCLTVWLDAPFELCWQRLNRDDRNARPLAREREQAAELYDSRLAAYQLAALRVRINAMRDAPDIATEIADAAAID